MTNMDYDDEDDYCIRWKDDDSDYEDAVRPNNHDAVNETYSRAKNKKLRQNKESLNLKNSNGKTALMLSVERRDFETLKVLLAAGADPNISRSYGTMFTALTMAIQKGLTFSVKELVRCGAHFTCEKGIEALELDVSKFFFEDLITGENKLFSVDEPKKNPFKTAIAVAFDNGRQSLLKKLMKCGLLLERTLLLDSTSNQPDLVRLLLDKGVDVNAASPSLDTALHKSAQNNNIETIKLLFGANSNINAVNKVGQTALHKAACVVYSEGSRGPELQKTNKLKNNLKIIRLLIRAKAKVNVKDQHGDTVLHNAVQCGKTETVKLLIDGKADANAINKSGETALHKAVDVDNTEIVKLLIGIASNINAPNVNGDTVLHKAARRNNLEITELLVRAKVHVNAINKNGETALHAASASSGTNSDLLNYKWRSNGLINSKRETATVEELKSTGCDQCAIVQYLIEAGGDVNLEDRYGNTPLSIAVTDDNQLLALILIKGKADVNKMYKKNRSIPSTSAQQTSPGHLLERYATDCRIVSSNKDQGLMSSREQDQSLLWMALSKKCTLNEMAKLLIQHGVDVNIPNTDIKTVLMLAVDQLDVIWVEDMIAAGADVDAADGLGHSVFIRAFRLAILEKENSKQAPIFRFSYTNVASKVENSSKILQLLLKAGCSINSQNFPNPMVLAVNGCHKDYVNLLLKHGGNVNAHDDELNTLIMLALRNNFLDIVELLITSGADVVTLKNKLGDVALHFAAKCKEPQIMQRILENIVRAKEKNKIKLGNKRRRGTDAKTFYLDMLNNRSETPLYKAAANGRGKNVKLLLKYGASANIQSEKGNTALMRALKHSFENVAKVLLVAEADVNIRNKRGENALLMAAESGCTETVKLLMEAGADPFSLTKFGNTGLSLAGNKDIAELFVQAGADVNLRNMHGQTPMHCAVKRRKDEVLNLLLKHGAIVNVKDSYGNTPLIAAFKVSDAHLILRLLGAKANVNHQNRKGKTALMYAANISASIRYKTQMQIIGKLSILDLLLLYGADANLKDNIGRTALMYTYSLNNQNDYGHKLVKRGADLEAEDYKGRTTLTQVLLACGMSSKVIELLKLGAKPVLKAKYRDVLIQRCPTVLVGKEINELLRLLICNGIVSMKIFKSYFPILLDTPYVELCLNHGYYDLLRYILANCYVSNKDLTYIRLRHNQSNMCALPERFGPDHNKMDALIQRAAGQPWPLVNLAFIAVSTMMGESPEREVCIENSQLPNPLIDMLMFQTEVARTAVGEWSTLPVCFEA